MNYQLVSPVKTRSGTPSPRVRIYLSPLMYTQTPPLPFQGQGANSGSSPSPLPHLKTPCAVPPTDLSHPHNGQAQAGSEVIPAKTAPLVRTSFAMHWEEGGRGEENLHFKHLYVF